MSAAIAWFAMNRQAAAVAGNRGSRAERACCAVAFAEADTGDMNRSDYKAAISEGAVSVGAAFVLIGPGGHHGLGSRTCLSVRPSQLPLYSVKIS